MKWHPKNWFKPKNALILVRDHLEYDDVETLKEQIATVREHYVFVKLSELIGRLEKKEGLGVASLVFENPRKSIFYRALSFLRTENIPLTFFIRSECLGRNRLPLEEELAAFQQAYPVKLTPEQVQEKLALAWEQPALVEKILDACRRECGPLPVEKLDPMRYFATWGRLLEYPPELLEIGIHIDYNPEHVEEIRQQLGYLRKQTQLPVSTGFLRKNSTDFRDPWKDLGLRGFVTEVEGTVKMETSPFQLPQWKWNRE